MRLPTLIVCLLAAAPALAASPGDHDDCNAADPDRNIAGCTRVLEDHGESDKIRSIAYVGRALAFVDKHNLDGALADFTAAIRLDPDNSLAYNDRAILWRQKGDVDRAIADFSAAIRIDPLPRSDFPALPASTSTPTARSPGRARATSTARSSISTRPSGRTAAMSRRISAAGISTCKSMMSI